MKREELAKILNVSLRTLSNWEKEKPELVELINLGLKVKDQILETKKYLEKLEEMKEEAKKGKFIL
jgi:DNA-binding XRE family transcriptional regulator